jgi:hypothetical protein
LFVNVTVNGATPELLSGVKLTAGGPPVIEVTADLTALMIGLPPVTLTATLAALLTLPPGPDAVSTTV